MMLTAIDEITISQLLEKLNKDCKPSPPYFDPFLTHMPVVNGDYYGFEDNRRRMTRKSLTYQTEQLLSAGNSVINQIAESVKIESIKICCEALFADVKFESFETRSALADDVATIQATSGFIRETFDEIRTQFEESDIDGFDLGVGISEAEHTALLQYSKLTQRHKDIQIEDGRVTFVDGIKILDFKKLKVFKEDNGVYSDEIE